jgi:hypothetical protein
VHLVERPSAPFVAETYVSSALKTLNTDLINFGDYWKYELAVEATCECGNKRVIHASELLKLIGDRMALERGRLDTLSRRMKPCLRPSRATAPYRPPPYLVRERELCPAPGWDYSRQMDKHGRTGRQLTVLRMTISYLETVLGHLRVRAIN